MANSPSSVRRVAEVIAVGDELTSGQRLDTNSQWISQQLADLGIPTGHHTTVGDDLERIAAAVRTAAARADCVILSGGLGPTADDLTREGIAAALGRHLELHPSSLDHIQLLFARRGSPMPERNRKQALLPAGGRPIPNPEGTAPGVAINIPRTDAGDCQLYSLPGVPAELRQMWYLTVGPELDAGGSGGLIRHRVLKAFGAGESDIESRLPGLIERGRTPTVGITAHEATITLRVTAEAPSAEECERQIEPTLKLIRQHLGNLVFGEEDEELEHAVVRLLQEKGRTLATVEVGTAGLVARWIGQLTGPTPVYRGGLVVRDRQPLAHLLQVPPEELNGLAPVSAETAVLLAGRWRELTGADYALGTTEVPQPSFPPPTQTSLPSAQLGGVFEPPQFFVAVASPSGVKTQAYPFTGHPAILHVRAAKNALNTLRLQLLAE